MEQLKTGIIGCGKVGDFHAKAYANLPNSAFTAVCDACLLYTSRAAPSRTSCANRNSPSGPRLAPAITLPAITWTK